MSSAIRIAIALAMMAISTTTSARSEVVCPPATQGDPLDRMSLFVGDPRNLVELAPVTPPSPRLGDSHFSLQHRPGLTAMDCVELFHATSHGDGTRGFIVAVPSSQPGDDPACRREAREQMRIALA